MNEEQQIKMRLQWVQMYRKTKDAGLVCRRCGISRPTLRKWVRRYQELGLEGLVDNHPSPPFLRAKKGLRATATVDFGVETE